MNWQFITCFIVFLAAAAGALALTVSVVKRKHVFYRDRGEDFAIFGAYAVLAFFALSSIRAMFYWLGK